MQDEGSSNVNLNSQDELFSSSFGHAQASTQPASSSQAQPTDVAASQTADPTTEQIENDLKNLSDEEFIDLFIQGIMIEKGSNVGSEEMQKDIFNDLKDSLLAEIDRSLVSELPDDKLEELNKIATEQGKIDPELITKMISEAELNVAEITSVTMARFRDIYLGTNETENI